MNDERHDYEQLIATLAKRESEVADLRRDLQVEQSLERVRTQVAAMQKSDTLFAIVDTVKESLVKLGVSCWDVGINIIDDATNSITLYSPYRSAQWNSNDTAGVLQKHIDHWRQGETYVRHYAQDELHQILQQWLESGRITKEKFAEDKERFEQIPHGVWVIDAPFSHGTMAMNKPGSEPFPDDHIRLVERFAEVFDLAYRRYLDLEAAERQVEESRREQAVERVRAEAMAMRERDDLFKVVAVMHDELIDLGVDLFQCKIAYIDEENDYHPDYVAIVNPRRFGLESLPSGMTEISDKTIVWLEEQTVTQLRERGDNHYERWQQGEPWSITAYELSAQMGKERPDPLPEGFNREFARKLGVLLPDNTIRDNSLTIVPFARGHVSIHMMDLEPVDVDIVKPFTEAISLGYLRFLDFDKVDQAQRQLIDELEEELQTARALQMSLMPTQSPQIEGFDIAGRCETVNHVGGDFFQYFQRGDYLAIGLADVTGHAMEAAVPVMMFSGVLKTEMRHDQPLGQLFANLNETLHDSLPKRTFVCFCMGEIDIQHNTVRLANGGCPYPLHYSAQTGQIAELQADAYPLGVRAQSDYLTVEQPLSPGDYLIFCSDGLIEAANADEEIYGFEQTAETIRQACADGLSAEALIDHLVSEIQTFVGDEPQGDDMTCVALRVSD